LSKPRILVIDDEAAIRESLRMILEYENYEFAGASNGPDGIAQVQRDRPDLVLLDIKMPAMDGMEVLRKIKAIDETLPVVMISGHGTTATAVEAIRSGATDFLDKPLSSERVIVTIQNTLSQSQLRKENRELKLAMESKYEIVGNSPTLRRVLESVQRAAPTNATVMLLGESGVGKELVARTIHRNSPRNGQRFVQVNCAAIPEELIESELFGHEAGAFTGATKQRRGKFERASGGTLFLDEVGDMPLAMQAKLLRVLQERETERVGGSETLKIDVRVVAATNRDLVAACESGAFRADLYDRLNVLPLTIPPLRAHREDVPGLARHFLGLVATANDRRDVVLEDDAIDALTAYSWPGNVRELRNVIERLVILTPDTHVHGDDVRNCLPSSGAKTVGIYRPGVPMRVLVEEAERVILQEAIAHHGGQMSKAARALDLERSHLYKKARALGLRGGPGADGGGEGGEADRSGEEDV